MTITKLSADNRHRIRNNRQTKSLEKNHCRDERKLNNLKFVMRWAAKINNTSIKTVDELMKQKYDAIQRNWTIANFTMWIQILLWDIKNIKYNLDPMISGKNQYLAWFFYRHSSGAIFIFDIFNIDFTFCQYYDTMFV